MQRCKTSWLDDEGIDVDTLTEYAEFLCEFQRSVMWWIGDAAIAAKRLLGDDWTQAFPCDVSPGLVARCEAVSRAYPKVQDRDIPATWTQYMREANKPNRLELLAAIVEKGQTTDESRRAVPESSRPRWLLAVDVHYHLHRHWFSGAELESAVRVTEWVQRTVERLKEKGLTDCVCCFDSYANFRKELTKDWQDRYKDRPPKPDGLGEQLTLVRELLRGAGFLCVSIEGFEADDVLASYADQFSGRVTILGRDKDLYQCLSDSCNMLLDVEWNEDPNSGDMMPEYKWLSAKQHTEKTGLTAAQWPDFQAIMGDNVDGIKGAPGIGQKGAADIIKEFASLDSAIEAARNDDERIKPKKRAALLELAEQLDVVRQLVTLRSDLDVPMNTRI